MKTIEVEAGEHITRVLHRLVAQAPARCTFNGIAVEAFPGDTVEAVGFRWDAEAIRRAREHKARQDSVETVTTRARGAFVGAELARKILERRGAGPNEAIYVSEVELAAMLAVAFEKGAAWARR